MHRSPMISGVAHRFARASLWRALGCLVAVLAVASVEAQTPAAPWQLPQWQRRVIVRIIPNAYGGINTGEVDLELEPGQIRPDAQDIRVLDSAGAEIKARLAERLDYPAAQDGRRTSLLRIQFPLVGAPDGIYLVYYGNPTATREWGEWDTQLGGLTLETRVNSTNRPAANWADMGNLLAGSRMKFGEGPRRQINDTENPFGPSDQYLSFYRGFVYCPTDGTYGFATDSDDSSFLVIDGKLVAQWPGGHNSAGNFDKNGTVELKAGAHRIEYYHVQAGGGALARAGWKVPGSDRYVTIPPEAFQSALRGELLAYETRNSPMAALFEWAGGSSLQFGGAGPVFATINFRDLTRSATATVAVREWDFGDGTVGTGETVSHVYNGGKTYIATLSVTDNMGFRSRYVRTVPVAATADTRVDVTTETDVDQCLLLPGETPQVTIRCRVAAPFALALDVITEIKDTQEKALVRERREVGFPPNAWMALAAIGGQTALPQNADLSEVSYTMEYRGVKVAAGVVAIRPVTDPNLNLRADGGRLLAGESDGHDVILRLSNAPIKKNLAAVRRKLAEGKPVRVVVVDDSVAGDGPSGYPDRLAEELRRLQPAADVTVMRIGLDRARRRTYDPLRDVADLPAEAAKLEPDLVVLAASLRDVLRCIPADRFERNNQALAERLAAQAGAPVLLMTPPPTLANRGLSETYAVAVKRVAVRCGLTVADAYSAFIRYGEGAPDDGGIGAWKILYRDPDSPTPFYHVAPTDKGQALLAATVARTLIGK